MTKMNDDFKTRMKYLDERLDLGMAIKRVERWDSLSPELKEDTLWFLRYCAENHRPPNNTPKAAFPLGRCLAWVGNWLIKLSERAG